jgi:hypothetical protein
MFKNLSQELIAEKDIKRRIELYRKLLHHEAWIGGQIFGPIAKDRRREFFCLDTYTWVWHEEWATKNGTPRYVTTRYDVKPHGIFKSQNGNYTELTADETANLIRAIRMYEQQIDQELYVAVGK